MSPPGPPVPDSVRVVDESSVIAVRRRIDDLARGVGFGIVEHTKLVTAASELTRNILQYAGSGRVELEILRDGERRGVQLVFSDQGPGIPDIDLAMRDGYSSGKGMGLGLPGTKRLVHQFKIETAIDKGTRVTIIMWRR